MAKTKEPIGGSDRLNYDRKMDAYVSKANRQDVPYMLPVRAFMQAKAREMERHDKARLQQQNTPQWRASKMDMINWEQECKDRDAMRNYTHHFTDMRGTATVKRANIVVKK